jgi:DNA-binding NarL/FixJ family response regulator
VSSLAVSEPLEGVAGVAVAADTRSAQLRLSSALAGWPALHLRVVSSLRRLLATGAADDLIVSYHGALCSDDCDSFKQVKTTFPELLIIAVCESADGRAVRRALDSGVDGLVLADELEAALGPTVAAALVGQIAVPRNLRACVRKPSLSAKERQVLRLLVMGITNSEISARLFLAESTVKSHLSSAYLKMGVRSRSEAVSLLLDPKEPLGIVIGVVAAPSVPSDALGCQRLTP